jgi:GNAT superfamily N-acetyltransferase
MVKLFQGHGNPGYCWCQLWRVPSAEYKEARSADRKAAMQANIEASTPVGILAYAEGQPVAWCSVAPRETYQKLLNSRTIKQVDDKQTWSIVCLYLDRAVRRQGLSEKILAAAVKHAKAQGAEVVEAYPVDPQVDDEGRWQATIYNFMGYTSSYRKAGFKDVTPAGSKRRVMRHA